MKLAIEKVGPPRGSLAEALVSEFADYVDAFRAPVDPARFPDAEACARAFLEQKPPAWIAAAMRTRDAIVGTLFGLKTAPKQGSIFHVLQRSEVEIIAGEDDRHLDFRVSIFHERVGEEAFVTVTTLVRFNNALGRAYFVPVRPAHRRIVPAMMRRALAQPTARHH